jgi:hypothetical protein
MKGRIVHDNDGPGGDVGESLLGQPGVKNIAVDVSLK